MFVVQYGFIHIYTRYNLAWKAAKLLKRKMSTLLLGNAFQIWLSGAISDAIHMEDHLLLVILQK